MTDAVPCCYRTVANAPVIVSMLTRSTSSALSGVRSHGMHARLNSLLAPVTTPSHGVLLSQGWSKQATHSCPVYTSARSCPRHSSIWRASAKVLRPQTLHETVRQLLQKMQLRGVSPEKSSHCSMKRQCSTDWGQQHRGKMSLQAWIHNQIVSRLMTLPSKRKQRRRRRGGLQTC